MNVKELIAVLNIMPQDATVYTSSTVEGKIELFKRQIKIDREIDDAEDGSLCEYPIVYIECK